LPSTATAAGVLPPGPLTAVDHTCVPAAVYFATNTLVWPLALVSGLPPKLTVPEKTPATMTFPVVSRATAYPMSVPEPPKSPTQLLAVAHAGELVSTVGIAEVPAEFHAATPYVYVVAALTVVSATGKTGVGPSCFIIVNVASVLALRYTL